MSTMSQAIKSALPSHFKGTLGPQDAEDTGRHHIKTQSHMVSFLEFLAGVPVVVWNLPLNSNVSNINKP